MPGSSKWFFPSGFPTKTLYTHLLSPIRATWPAHFILDFITRTILGEQYRSLSCSLCGMPHPTKPPDLHPHPQAQETSRLTNFNHPIAIIAHTLHQKLLV
jgi:hypothetical protein